MKTRLDFLKELAFPLKDFVSKLDINVSSYKQEKGYLCEEDVLVNNFIIDQISSCYPNDHIISEENLNEYQFNRKGSVWIIDPICGTTNYLREIPFFANSISCIDESKLIFSCILDVNRSEFFLNDGKYSFLNNNKINVSKTKRLEEAIISINCNQSSFKSNSFSIDHLFKKLKPPTTRRIKIFESANLELAYVAAGRLDAYINPDDKIWDMVAGSQLIKNAGGSFHIFEGDISNFGETTRGIVGTNEYLLEQILEKILQ